MDGSLLAPDAGIGQLVIEVGRQLVIAGLLSVKGMQTLAGLASLLATLCTVASLILVRLTPPRLDPPTGGSRLGALLWRLHVGFYWTVRILALAHGRAAPVEQPGTRAVMAPVDRHAEMVTLVAKAVPEPRSQAEP